MKLWKKGIILGLAVALAIACVPEMNVRATEVPSVKVAIINNANLIEDLSAVRSVPVTVNPDEKAKDFFRFTVKEDSWVYVAGSLTLNDGNGITECHVYRDEARTKEVGATEWGDVTVQIYPKQFTAFLKKGTYYVETTTTKTPGNSLCDANVNTFISAIPIKKVFSVSVKNDKKKQKAMITWNTNVLGEYVKLAQYQPGNISLTKVNDGHVWKILYGTGSGKCKSLKIGKNKFTVSKVKKCTIMLEDTNESRWSVVLNTGIKTSKKK